MKPIILASSSIYRKALLEKLGIPFSGVKPIYDEDEVKAQLLRQKKTPIEIAEHLSRGKAQSIVQPEALIIAGDQLVQFEEVIFGKPKNFESALEQLKKLNGKSHELITAVTLKTDEQTIHFNHITKLKMKRFSEAELVNYLKKDEPFDAAGSYKIEERGIILFERIDTDDFSAIQGLPLLWISLQLRKMGYEFFKD